MTEIIYKSDKTPPITFKLGDWFLIKSKLEGEESLVILTQTTQGVINFIHVQENRSNRMFTGVTVIDSQNLSNSDIERLCTSKYYSLKKVNVTIIVER